MFIQPCFIRNNSKALRDRLRKMGYKPFWSIDDIEDVDSKGLAVNNKPWGYPSFFIIYNPDHFIKNGFIDCKDNEELFFALAALNDKDDYNQWFTNDIEWVRCSYKTWKEQCSYYKDSSIYYRYHKADVDELRKHFRKSWFRRIRERIGI